MTIDRAHLMSILESAMIAGQMADDDEIAKIIRDYGQSVSRVAYGAFTIGGATCPMRALGLFNRMSKARTDAFIDTFDRLMLLHAHANRTVESLALPAYAAVDVI